jgi:hypothetical protein
MSGMQYMTPVGVVPPGLGDEGLHMRHGNRARKASLSGGVPVERISDLSPEEPFDEATKELNQEILDKKSSKTNGRTHYD